MFSQPRTTLWGRLSDYQRDEILLQIVEQLDDMNRRSEKFEVKGRQPAFKSVGTKCVKNSQDNKIQNEKTKFQATTESIQDEVEIKEEDHDIVCLPHKDEAKEKTEAGLSSLTSVCSNKLQNLEVFPLTPQMEFSEDEQLTNVKAVDPKEIVSVESWMENGTDDSVYVFTGHASEVHTVVPSPTDALLVAAGGGDEKGFLCKIGHGDWIQQFPERAKVISISAISSTGQLLVSTGFDGFLQILEISSSNLRCFLEGLGEGIEWVKCHPSGHMVLASSKDSTIWMWNIGINTYMDEFVGDGNKDMCADFTGVENASFRICPATCNGNMVTWMQARCGAFILQYFRTRGRVFSNRGRMMQTRKRSIKNRFSVANAQAIIWDTMDHGSTWDLV